MSELPDVAFAAVLSELPKMGPKRLRAVVADRSAAEAFDLIRSREVRRDRDVCTAIAGRAAPVLDEWIRQAQRVDVAARWEQYQAAGVGVAARSSVAYPEALAADIEPPEVVFHRGDLDAVAGTRVAIVGTRNCTNVGCRTAAHFGARLAEAGIAVVSGLALGIDAAAHRGALSVDGAPPIAVVGSGLNVPYPRRNIGLWRQVAGRGVVLGEAPLDAQPEKWRFPARNRIIAALADVVVVVESHARGGSLLTAADAAERNVQVLAVPGSIYEPASAGTNNLLADGCQPATSIDDVFLAVGMIASARRPAHDPRTLPTPQQQLALDAVGWQPATLDEAVIRSGLSVADVAGAVESLIAAGWLSRTNGWLERVSHG